MSERDEVLLKLAEYDYPEWTNHVAAVIGFAGCFVYACSNKPEIIYDGSLWGPSVAKARLITKDLLYSYPHVFTIEEIMEAKQIPTNANIDIGEFGPVSIPRQYVPWEMGGENLIRRPQPIRNDAFNAALTPMEQLEKYQRGRYNFLSYDIGETALTPMEQRDLQGNPGRYAFTGRKEIVNGKFHTIEYWSNGKLIKTGIFEEKEQKDYSALYAANRFMP